MVVRFICNEAATVRFCHSALMVKKLKFVVILTALVVNYLAIDYISTRKLKRVGDEYQWISNK
jgi:hypothetical protein